MKITYEWLGEYGETSEFCLEVVCPCDKEFPVKKIKEYVERAKKVLDRKYLSLDIPAKHKYERNGFSHDFPFYLMEKDGNPAVLVMTGFTIIPSEGENPTDLAEKVNKYLMDVAKIDPVDYLSDYNAKGKIK